ncbi:MAG TPA: 30S ribosomal protein S12 methylthiotransferase RimO [Firmicutes bacterium]|nr:30S ribosomal protein S12 methylthiotransferase RimO [Bacillota bacterium]
MKIGWISLGCPKNQVDTEYMIGLSEEAGFARTANPEEADVLVINTCSFIESATQESIDTILEFAAYKQKNCRLLVVAGCLPQRYRQELVKALPEVDLWVGTGEYARLPELLTAALEKKGAARLVADAPAGWLPPSLADRPLTTPPHYAYVKIAEGCNHHCLYCIIPKLKGEYRSRKPESIIAEVENLLARGVKEINLVAQDTTAYGTDFDGAFNLSSLLSRLDKLEGDFWIRLFYTYPSLINEELLRTIRDSRHICHYLDIPLQHVSSAVLKRMGRRGTEGEIRALIGRVRQYLPEAAIRSTFIVGYPGETEEDFAQLLAFLAEVRLDWVGVFPYYREEGTAAARLPGQVHHATKKRRARLVLEQQQNHSAAKNRALIGRELRVLLEKEKAPGWWEGRSYREAPGIDGVVQVQVTADQRNRLAPGTFVQVQIEAAGPYELSGKIKTNG